MCLIIIIKVIGVNIWQSLAWSLGFIFDKLFQNINTLSYWLQINSISFKYSCVIVRCRSRLKIWLTSFLISFCWWNILILIFEKTVLHMVINMSSSGHMMCVCILHKYICNILFNIWRSWTLLIWVIVCLWL